MIKVSQLVDSQLSDFFRQEYPTFVKFFEEYYKATEIDGASVGLVRNIQKYQDADFYKDGIVLETSLYDSITATDTSIQLSSKTDNDGREIWKRFPSEGILLEVLFEKNDVVPVGEVIARIGEKGESVSLDSNNKESRIRNNRIIPNYGEN